ncbi:vWA domain-containing protein [Paenibacillus cremeus]|nr:VWA domain-containing protein [Paenibacillus cremeus]
MNPSIQLTHAWNKNYWPTGGTEKAFLLLELKGTATMQTERASMNISLVLDRSGSMSGAPLAFSKKACQYVIDQMVSDDTLSIVVFDDEVTTVLQPQNIMHKDLMKQRIESIQTGGSTNLSGGLLQGIQYVLKSKREGSINRVILLSDGHANQGITDPLKLQSIVKEFQGMGVGVTTMGVGDGFDEELMEGIADSGGGNFYFIEKPEDVPGIFSKELTGLLSVIAQNVQLTIKPTEAASITHIYGYNAEESERGLMLTLGDVFAQETKSVLIELSLFPYAVGKGRALELQWDFVDVTEEVKICTMQYAIEANFTNDIDLINNSSNPHIEKQVQITESAMTIQHAIAAFDLGDVETGKQLLQQQADAMLCSAVQSDDAELREEARMLYDHLENFTYSSNTRKSLHEQKYRQMKRKK